jgi:hypothetical protein
VERNGIRGVFLRVRAHPISFAGASITLSNLPSGPDLNKLHSRPLLRVGFPAWIKAKSTSTPPA